MKTALRRTCVSLLFIALVELFFLVRQRPATPPVQTPVETPTTQTESLSSPTGVEIAHGESALPHVLLHPGDCRDIIHVNIPQIVNDPLHFNARFGWLQNPKNTPGFEYEQESLDMWQTITPGYMTLHLCNYTSRDITPDPVRFWWAVRQYGN